MSPRITLGHAVDNLLSTLKAHASDPKYSGSSLRKNLDLAQSSWNNLKSNTMTFPEDNGAVCSLLASIMTETNMITRDLHETAAGVLSLAWGMGYLKGKEHHE